MSDTDPHLPVVPSSPATSSARLEAVIVDTAKHEEGLIRRMVIKNAAVVTLGTIVVGAFLAGWTALGQVDTRKDRESADASIIHRVEKLEEQATLKEVRDAERYMSLYTTILSRLPDPRSTELGRPVLAIGDGGAP